MRDFLKLFSFRQGELAGLVPMDHIVRSHVTTVDSVVEHLEFVSEEAANEVLEECGGQMNYTTMSLLRQAVMCPFKVDFLNTDRVDQYYLFKYEIAALAVDDAKVARLQYQVAVTQ